jgi:hypothetical protein
VAAEGARGEEICAPILLKGLDVANPDQVWAIDITYIPMAYGFMYLTAIIDDMHLLLA